MARRQRPFVGYWPDPQDRTDQSVDRAPVDLVTPDGAVVRGVLSTPRNRGWSSAVVLAHPRADFTVHYATDPLVSAGIAVLGIAGRYVNNDTDCLHERCLVDIETVVAHLRTVGAEHVTLLGNSGGGPLMALAQAGAAREGRTLGDAFIALAAHPGEGRYLQRVIDPSVTDEHDPHATDPSLDMYDPANGWRPWPEPCAYEADWLARYRAAQDRRMQRIDAIAQRAQADRRQAREAAEACEAGSAAWNQHRRRAVHGPYLTVYRTLADPAHLDPTIEPDDRPLGSIFAAGDPLVANYGYGGLARTVTPRAWLSTWSARHSAAAMEQTLPDVTTSTLIVHGTADTEIRMADADAMRAAAGADDLTFLTVEGAPHYLQGHRRATMEAVATWLTDRAPLAPAATGGVHGPATDADPTPDAPTRLSRAQVIGLAALVGLLVGIALAVITGFPGWIVFAPVLGVGAGDLLAGWRR